MSATKALRETVHACRAAWGLDEASMRSYLSSTHKHELEEDREEALQLAYRPQPAVVPPVLLSVPANNEPGRDITPAAASSVSTTLALDDLLGEFTPEEKEQFTKELEAERAERAAQAEAFDPLPNVPGIFKTFPNWVTWKSATEKAPIISGTGEKARSNDPSTWATYQTACDNIRAGKGLPNLGFVTDGVRAGNLTGIDIDGCRNPQTGEIASWAQRILALLGSTYTEITPSKTGLRAWVICTFPKRSQKVFGLNLQAGFGEKVQIEVYDDGKYFTMTGDKLADSVSEVVTLTNEKVVELFELLGRLEAEHPARKTTSQKKKTPRTQPVSKEDGRVVFEEVPPDPGYAQLFEAVGWKPLIDRMSRMHDTRFHNLEFEPGKLTCCPMPGHGTRSENLEYQPCFGPMAGKPGVLHCFGCDFTGDLCAAVKEFDGGEDGGKIEYETMYDCARAICQQEGLKFEDFFPADKPAPQAAAQASSDVPGQTTARLVRADQITCKKVEYLWEPRIPLGKLSVLAGNPDKGKSLVSLYMVTQLTRGLAMYGCSKTMPACEALIMAAEDDDDDTLTPRLKAAGADLTKVHFLTSIVVKDGQGQTQSEREAQLDTDIQLIEQELRKNPQIKLVVIDPVSSYLGRANMNREQEVREVLTPLKRLASRCRVGIVLIMHFNKSVEASAIHRIGGAVAFTGVARAVWMFAEDPEDQDRYLMLRVKANLARKQGGLVYKIQERRITIENESVGVPYVEFVGETDTSADVLVGPHAVGRPDIKSQSAKEWLLEYLAEGSQDVRDIEAFGRKAGHSWRTLERAKTEIQAVATQSRRRWSWCLPGHAERTNVVILDASKVNLPDEPKGVTEEETANVAEAA